MPQRLISIAGAILSPFTSDPPSQLDVLGHDGHTLRMNSTQVRVLEQTHKVCLGCLLECKHSMALEPQISLEILSNFPDKPLEWQLPNQKLRALLVLADLTKSNSARSITVRLLHSTGCGGRLAGSLGGKLLPRCLASCGLASSLLGTSHLLTKNTPKNIKKNL